MRVIWNTADFDYAYTLDILHEALGELAQHLKEHDIHVNAQKDANRIEYARRLIRRHQDEVASNMVYGRHDRKWGKTVGVSVPIPNSKFSEWRYVRLNARTPKEIEQEEEEFRRAMDKARLLEDRDWDEIWDIIKKYGRHWWC